VHVTPAAPHVVSAGVQHCVALHAVPSQTIFAALLMIDVPANVGARRAHEACGKERGTRRIKSTGCVIMTAYLLRRCNPCPALTRTSSCSTWRRCTPEPYWPTSGNRVRRG
jgi:hypothetical protein